mmetsp:Transcript_44894/g.66013  ORF Transcript_44894/g.66013 Transcript_44894/m.66013 type:complete len:257 (+) Transcript_44894:304-1074(+)
MVSNAASASCTVMFMPKWQHPEMNSPRSMRRSSPVSMSSKTAHSLLKYTRFTSKFANSFRSTYESPSPPPRFEHVYLNARIRAGLLLHSCQKGCCTHILSTSANDTFPLPLKSSVVQMRRIFFLSSSIALTSFSKASNFSRMLRSLRFFFLPVWLILPFLRLEEPILRGGFFAGGSPSNASSRVLAEHRALETYLQNSSKRTLPPSFPSISSKISSYSASLQPKPSFLRPALNSWSSMRRSSSVSMSSKRSHSLSK